LPFPSLLSGYQGSTSTEDCAVPCILSLATEIKHLLPCAHTPATPSPELLARRSLSLSLPLPLSSYLLEDLSYTLTVCFLSPSWSQDPFLSGSPTDWSRDMPSLPCGPPWILCLPNSIMLCFCFCPLEWKSVGTETLLVLMQPSCPLTAPQCGTDSHGLCRWPSLVWTMGL
jgi:hypothetical protein